MARRPPPRRPPARNDRPVAAGGWSRTVTIDEDDAQKLVIEQTVDEPRPRLLRIRASRPVFVFLRETFPLSQRVRSWSVGGSSGIPLGTSNAQRDPTFVQSGINLKVYGSIEVRASGINADSEVRAEIVETDGDIDAPPMELTVDFTDALAVYTWVVDTATNDAAYGLDLTDPHGTVVDVGITADASATKGEIADAMAAAWAATDAADWFTAVSDGVDTVTFTQVVDTEAGATIAEDESAALTTLTLSSTVTGDPGPWVDVGHSPEGAHWLNVDCIGVVELRLVDDQGTPETVSQWQVGPDPVRWVHGPLYKLQGRHPGGFSFPTGTRKGHFTWYKG